MSLWVDLLGAEVGFVGTRFRTRALRAGSGSPLLLMHGSGGSLENFGRNIPAYAQHYRVVAMDTLWHGLSEKPPIDEALVPTVIEQILDVLDSQEIERCRIEGQSMGGWFAAHFALRHPERVEKLVLTTPSLLENPLTTPDPAKLAAGLERQLEPLRNPTAENVAQRITWLVKDPSVITAEMHALRLAFYSNPEVNAGLRAAATAYNSVAAQSLKLGPDELGRLSMPVLLYWGTHNFGGPAAGKAIAAALPPGSRYHCPDVGHWAQYEQADEHNRVVLDFLVD